MHHLMSALLTTKKLFSSASVKKRKKEQDCYLNNGSAVLEEILALCNGNCRIPIRYFTATEIERAIKHSEKKIELDEGYMVTGSLDNHLFLIRFSLYSYGVHRDITITAQMSHLKNVLRLIGCCLEFEEPVMVYEYIEGISLGDLLFEEGNHDDQTRKSLLSWGSRLRITNENSSIAKIVDFSFSIPLPSGELEVQDRVCGTIEYLDPEYGYCDSAISEETINFENFLPNLIDRYIKEGNIMDIADNAILEEHGIEIQQQLEDYLNLVKKCTTYNRKNRPYMIQVAKELCRIHKCFHAFTLGQI
ncbi:serine/threonine-protein kinase ZRK4 [Capsicum chacoense]